MPRRNERDEIIPNTISRMKSRLQDSGKLGDSLLLGRYGKSLKKKSY